MNEYAEPVISQKRAIAHAQNALLGPANRGGSAQMILRMVYSFSHTYERFSSAALTRIALGRSVIGS